MLLSEINRAISGISYVVCDNSEDIDIQYLLTDSRQLGNDPLHTLFFALKTNKDDGAKYIPQLRQKGVKAFVLDNSLDALQALATYKRNHYKGKVIGITGSNGKTVVKEWLYQLLKDDFHITRSPRSYNSQIGVPLSVWLLDEQTDLAIFEAGISQPGEMERLEPMIRPTIGVVTYIGEEHNENFISLEQKRAEKMRLFRRCPVVVEDTTHQNVRTCAAVMRALGYSEDAINRRLMQQTHETVLQVSLNALYDNISYFRSQLKSTTKLTCMVKAFAYGAGSVEVSMALQQSGKVDCLAVAVADEGVELRQAGVTLPIIIMDPEVSAIELILENNLEPNIYSLNILQIFVNELEKRGLDHFPIHIKVDSGMHRLGFSKEEIPSLVAILNRTKTVCVKSVFSHLAAADEEQWDGFTLQQIQCFTSFADTLEEQIHYKPFRHILNTAGIERFTPYQMDMCRLGIGMYGFSFTGAKLKNVCTLKTTILSVKTVKKGVYVSRSR